MTANRKLGRIKTRHYLRWLAANAATLPRTLQPGLTWQRFYERVHHLYTSTTGRPVYDPGFDDRQVKEDDNKTR